MQHKDGDYFYPLTTIDQVIMEDGITRLNGADLVSVNTDGAPEGETVKVNADTLGGYSADNFIKNTEEINADTLGGISADEYVKLSDLEHLDTSGISIELLWENASPSSEFAAQTVNYNSEISENNLVLVIGSEYNTTPNHTYNYCTSTISYIGAKGLIHFAFNDGGSIATRHRGFIPSVTGITFESSYGVKSTGTTAINNSKCIPQRIYVIKGVSV